MKKLTTWMTVFVLLGLTGCNWLGLRDRSNDYLLAEETQPTVIPGEMDGARLGQLYPVPPIPVNSVELEGFEVPRPQPASVNTFEQEVKIQSIDGRRWVLINISPSEVWPRIRNLLNRNGVPSAKAEGSTGIIETVWVSFKSDEENAHRFRFYISPGVQLDSTEIAALHQEIPLGKEDTAVWPDDSNSDTREKDMLSLVANELAAASDYASVSLLAQDIGGEAKVKVVTPEAADPFISIKLGFDRSWASVIYAAARGGFTVIDQNRTKGVMYVNYTQASEEETGFFSGLFGGGSDSDDLLKVNYQILVLPVGSNIEARIVGADGEGLSQAESLRLLTILRGNMS